MRKFLKIKKKVLVLETKSFGKFFLYVKTGFKVKRGQKKRESKGKKLHFFFIYALLLGGTKFH